MDPSRKNSPGLLSRLLGLGSSATERLAAMVRLALVTFGVVAVAYLVASYFLSGRIAAQGGLGALAVASLETGQALQEMRHNEKDFFQNRNKDELDRHKVNYEKALAMVDNARANANATSEELKTLETLRADIVNYRKLFLEAAELQIKLGVDEDSGLQGALRKSARDAEASIVERGLSTLNAALLTLRRNEKDFLLRAADGQGEEYRALFDKNMAEMRHLLANSKIDGGARQSITRDLAAYEKGFHGLVAGTYALEKALSAARVVAKSAQEPVAGIVSASAERRTVAVGQSQGTLMTSGAVLMAVLSGLAYLLWSTMRAADAALADRLVAQRKAEAENEQLNNSVISILQAVHQLSQRDLTARAPVTTDIIGTVSDSINALAGETSKVLQGVSQIAGQVAHASGKVKDQAQLVSQTAADERRSVDEMIGSLADATQTMNQVAALAEQSNRSATSATQATDTALATVNGTVRDMESIRETIAETEKRIKRLGERSQEISGIVDLINTIAERTHVLALNASMQAAVAGEAGRGFAVVAEEVQRLAESSRNATQQIGTLVNNIQIETNETINTVNRTINQVVQGSEQAQKAGEQMRATQELTGALVAQVQRIAQASEHQKEMSSGLLLAVQRIGQSAERTAQQIAAQNEETQTLQDSARLLVNSVNVFKLPQFAA
jgi:methyl-accepting chemotaxis protein